jgi:putative phage-type endonuclease
VNITRITHDVQQGTAEWLRLREGYCTASEAPAALGVSRYVSRAKLLRRKHTGIADDPDAATLGRFAAGHAAEALARPIAEANVGDDLYPVTMSATIGGLRLLASLDGLTLDGEIAWETKLWNEDLAECVRRGELPEHYTVQMDQELLVSGAKSCLFTCTDGTPERYVAYGYTTTPERIAALLAGWHQFNADLADYVLPQAAEAAPVGKAPETLPALRIEVTGAVTASNLAEFKATALGAIRSVNRTLKTDQDFADAEKAVKWCADVESRIKAAKEHALSQTQTIDALFKTLDDITSESKTVRLDLDKLVARRKGEVKEEIVTAAQRALNAHIARLNAEIAPMRLPAIVADFGGCIKGLKSVASMQDKLDGLLATTKIAAEADARAIRENVTAFQAQAGGFEFLFADLGQIIHKAADDFGALVTARIATHKAAEDAREAKRKADEAARVAAEATVKAAQDTSQPAPQQVLKAEPATADATDRGTPAIVSPRGGAMGAGPAAAAAPAVARDEPATLSLGAICDRLGFTVTGLFISSTLRVSPARTEKRGSYYTETQFRHICRQIATHVEQMADTHEGQPA